jgi:hypothetical protein
LFDNPCIANENIPHQPLPDRAEIRFKQAPLYRYRNKSVAVTVAGDPGGITQGTWDGKQRADAFMSLHHGTAILDAIKIHWGSGTGAFKPEKIEYAANDELLLNYADPSWDLLAYFRPEEKWGTAPHQRAARRHGWRDPRQPR